MTVPEPNTLPNNVRIGLMKMAWLRTNKATPGEATLGERAVIFQAGSNKTPFGVVVERQSTYYIPEKSQKLDDHGAVEYQFSIVPALPKDQPSNPISPDELEALRFVFGINSIDHDAACVRRSVTLDPSTYARCFCERKMDIHAKLIRKADGTGFINFSTVTRSPSPANSL